MKNLHISGISHAAAIFFAVLCLSSTVYLQTGEGWKWRFEVKDYVYSDITAGKNNLYISGGDSVAALDAQTGREKWHYNSRPNTQLNERAEIDGKLILLERDDSGDNAKPKPDNVVALDAASGREIWRKDYGGSYIEQMTVSGELVYLNVENIGLAVLKAAGGEVVWESDACPDVVGKPFVDGKIVYVECFGGKTYAIDAESGKLQWKSGTRGTIPGSYVFSGSSVFYNHSGTRNDKLFALDKNSGLEKWSVPAANPYAEQTFAGNLLITGTIKNASVSLVDPVSGKIVSQFAADGKLPPVKTAEEPEDSWRQSVSMPAAAGARLYFGSGTGYFFAVESTSGKTVWNRKLSEEKIITPEIIGAKAYTFIVENKTHYLAAINLADGLISWRMRLYGGASELLKKDNLLFFKTDDNKINAVAPLELDKLARLKKTFGASSSVRQIITDTTGSGNGIGSGSGDFPTSVEDDSQAELSGGKAFVTVSRRAGSALYEIDAATGERKILYEHAPEQLSKPQIKGSAFYYLGSDLRSRHTLYAFDKSAGKMLWKASGSGSALMPPVVSDKYVAYIADFSVLYVYSLDGTLLIKQRVESSGAFNRYDEPKQIIVIGGETVFLSDNKSVTAYDLTSGKQKWRKEFPERLGNLAVGSESVFTGSENGNLYALNRETGEINWQRDVMGTLPYSGNNVYTDGAFVYYASSSDYKNLLQAYDAAGGNLVWERVVGEMEIKFGGDYVFTKSVGRVFNKTSGKSAFYDNLLEVRKFSLLAASENQIILARERSETPNKLTLTAIDLQNGNKILWRLDFSQLDLKPLFDPKSTDD